MENYCIKKEVYCDQANNLGICQSTSCINGTVHAKKYVPQKLDTCDVCESYTAINYEKMGMCEGMNEPACCIEWKRATYCPNCGRKLAERQEEV